jgi:hypothetical protein
MKNSVSQLLISLALIHTISAHAADATPFSFGVIAKPVQSVSSETVLREAI